jgi:hypothetical protein
VTFSSPAYLRTEGGDFVLIRALVYEGRTDSFVIPAGSRTDFASVPRILRWLIPVFSAALTLAAIVHDELCRLLALGRCPASARDVDGIFRRMLREADEEARRNGDRAGRCGPWARALIWTGVRWGALLNPARRPGWLRDAPAVLAVSALALPIVLVPTVAVLVALALNAVVGGAVSLVRKP